MNKLAIYFSDDITHKSNKMGVSVLFFADQTVACVVNSKHAGKNIADVYPFLSKKQIVNDLQAARQLGADTLLFGLTPSGGLPTTEFLDMMQIAIKEQMKIMHGFHETPKLIEFENSVKDRIKNLRKPDQKYLIKCCDKARFLKNTRILAVGTDMAVGKMTASLQLNKRAQERQMHSEFLATGQVGIAIAGKGIPLDAIKLDFAGGAVEALITESKAKIVFIEGQGSILNPASAATLPLIRGSAPTHFILCHDASLSSLKDFNYLKLPSFTKLIELYEQIAEGCGLYCRPKTLGICVNTSSLTTEHADSYMQMIAKETGKIVLDPIREYNKLDLILDQL